ncbi:MAG: hypothetical protein ACI9MR_002089 [Myxococcota bacterium]
MPEVAFIAPTLRVLDDLPGDLVIVSAFSDERPLQGMTGLLDWRLCGALSRWRLGGFSTGALGERVLYPAGVRLSHPRVLLMGLGERAQYRVDRAMQVVDSAFNAAEDLGATRVSSTIFHLDSIASPLRRTGSKLIDRIQAATSLERVHLITDEETEATIRDGRTLFTSIAGH